MTFHSLYSVKIYLSLQLLLLQLHPGFDGTILNLENIIYINMNIPPVYMYMYIITKTGNIYSFKRVFY